MTRQGDAATGISALIGIAAVAFVGALTERLRPGRGCPKHSFEPVSGLGVTLIAAALVIPPTIARMLTHSFGRMLVLSTAIGGLTGLVGMYLSYHLDISSGPCIVLVSFPVFTVVYAATGVQGLRLSIGVRRYAPNLRRSRTGLIKTHSS